MVEAEAPREQRPLDEAELPFPRAAPRHEPLRLKAVPYYTWDNRDEGDMQVWPREKEAHQHQTRLSLSAHVVIGYRLRRTS